MGGTLSFLSTKPDKDVFLLAARIPSAKGWEDLGKTRKAEASQAKEVAPGTSKSVLKGQAADSREGFGK